MVVCFRGMSQMVQFSHRIVLCMVLGACLAVQADAPINLSGDYTTDQEFTVKSDTTINFNGATFTNCRLKLVGDVTFTFNLVDGTRNVFMRDTRNEYCIKATKNSNIVITGGGALEIISGKQADEGDGILACNNLTVRGGDTSITLDAKAEEGDKPDPPCVWLKGDYLQTGGRMKVKGDKKNCTNEFTGVYFENDGTTFTLQDGTFNAEMGGTKSRAISLRKTGTATFKGGKCKMEFAGPEGRFVNGGTLLFEGGTFNFVTNVTMKMTDSTFHPRHVTAVKADHSVTITGGEFEADLPLEGSKVFTTDSMTGSFIDISGGTFDLVSGGDCINARENIEISGGSVRAVSVLGDAMDANGNLVISGGDIRAYATAFETYGLHVSGNKTLKITGGIVVATDGVSAELIGSGVTSAGRTDFVQATYYGTQSTTDYTSRVLGLDGVTNGVAFTVNARLPSFPGGGSFNLLVSMPGRAATVPGEEPPAPDEPETPGNGTFEDGEIIARGYRGVYDGVSHTVDVAIPDGARILSSTSRNGEYTDVSPGFKGVGEHAVWYRIAKDGYCVYTGSVRVVVTPKMLLPSMVSLPGTDGLIADGVEKKPVVVVADGEPSIITADDYDVVYDDNVDPGTATVTITGKRNYTGVVVKAFTIKPPSDGVPRLGRQVYTFELYRGFGVSGEYDVYNLQGGASRVSLKKIGRGRLPSGVKLKYDKKTGKVLLSGSPTKAGYYEYVMRINERVGRVTRQGVETMFRFFVADPALLLPGDDDYNPVVGRKVTTTIPVFTTDKSGLAGLLTVSISTRNAISARIKGVTRRSLSFRGGWQEIEKGVLRTTLVTRTGESLTLILLKNGNICAILDDLTGGLYGSELASTDWGVAAIPGDYTKYLPLTTATAETGEMFTVKVSAKGKVSYKSTTDRSVRGTAQILLNAYEDDGAAQLCLVKTTGRNPYKYVIKLD